VGGFWHRGFDWDRTSGSSFDGEEVEKLISNIGYSELTAVSTVKWRRRLGIFVLCGGTHSTKASIFEWVGRWAVISCPWFQLRWEQNRMYSGEESFYGR
jgi:hypothetical protein